MITKTSCKDSGFTLIELLVSFVIVLSALIALFVGIQFAEKQIYKNYHNRQAMLIASGELEYQYYRKIVYGDFAPDVTAYGDSIVLDSSQKHRIDANIRMGFRTELSEDGFNLPHTIVTVEVSWREPADNMKIRTVRLIEDYYDSPVY